MNKRKPIVIAVLLMITVSNYFRIKGTEDIRAIEFLTIFVIGALSALLINALVPLFRERR